MPRVHIGLSGYSYGEWQGEGKLYPPTLKPHHYFRYYATRYDALEAVGTFTHAPSEITIGKWVAETPDGFQICPKMHQRVTHFGRLKPETREIVEEMAKALEPVAKLGKLGPVLIQLPPNLKRNDLLLGTFLGALPKDFQWAVEFRHESWNVAEVEALLRTHRVARVGADTDEADALLRDTAEFRYVRLRKSAYDDAALTRWADELKRTERPAYVFCRHTDIAAPWRWADRLVELTGTRRA